jgi:hypothetical protein
MHRYADIRARSTAVAQNRVDRGQHPAFYRGPGGKFDQKGIYTYSVSDQSRFS